MGVFVIKIQHLILMTSLFVIAIVKGRETFRHWELDTVVSSRDPKEYLASFVANDANLYRLTDTKPFCRINGMCDSQVGLVLPTQGFLTATMNRVKEFSCYKTLEKELKTPFNFADPYTPWQRESNENRNGLLWGFFPKKTELTENELKEALTLINNRPRKCLGWKTAHECFKEQVLRLI
ncbi:IS30 family transposase [Viridibacillus sp. NPDC096237]|uniref:IS30 family transposase n=1 Tax=Viridibacillus sp. NPDC096237 TaxID=3390721 RepID=UPI003D0900FF